MRHFTRAKLISDYPELKTHEAVLIAALREWVPIGRTLPTRETIGSFKAREAKLALRLVIWDPKVKPEAKEPARNALYLLKQLHQPYRGNYI